MKNVSIVILSSALAVAIVLGVISYSSHGDTKEALVAEHTSRIAEVDALTGELENTKAAVASFKKDISDSRRDRDTLRRQFDQAVAAGALSKKTRERTYCPHRRLCRSAGRNQTGLRRPYRRARGTQPE